MMEHYGQIGCAEDDARHIFEHPLRERHDMAEFMGQDLLSLDSGLSVCDEEETVPVKSESSPAAKSKAKKNIDFLTDVVTGKLHGEDNNDEYAYIPKTDLQLAAELGKTLLERNQELEESGRRLQITIEEQSREIDYLTTQVCQLRDSNEARLRIYEALEQSVGELERNNRSLHDESKTDKKRIKALCASLELVEQHCEELQEEMDVMRVLPVSKPQTHGHENQNGQTKPHNKAKSRRNYTSSEESNTDEESGIHGSDESDFAGFEDTPLELQEVLRLRSDMARLRSQISREQRMRETLSSELERSIQENARLREELLSSRERERLSLNLQMEMGDTAGALDVRNELCSNYQTEGEEDNCASETPSVGGPEAEAEHEEGNTLLYELDMQYRVLIEKYESLLEARRRDFEAEDALIASVPSQVQRDAGPGSDPSSTLELLGSPSAEAALEAADAQHKDAACQTEIQILKKREQHFVGIQPVTQPPKSCSKFPKIEPAISSNVPSGQQLVGNNTLSTLSSAERETFDKHFEHSPPEYKKLFTEIFAVLKRKVAEMPPCASGVAQDRQSSPILPDLESRLECNLEKLKSTVPPHVRSTRSYAEVVRARLQQAQQYRTQAQRSSILDAHRRIH